MHMQHACKEILSEVEGSLGCIVIDMQTGLTVAGEYRQGTVMNPATVNLVSVASSNMFRGKLIRQFESALSLTAPKPNTFVHEVHMATEQTNQFMSAIPGWDHGLLVLITDKTVSVGLGWMAVHRVIGQVTDSLSTPSLGVTPAPQAAAPPLVDPTATQGAVPQLNEPYPDANHYAPPPTVLPQPAQAPAEPPTDPDDAKRKARVSMGPRMSMHRRK